MTNTLFHLKVSSYNEKARWALDYKNVPHERKAIETGRHPKLAEKLAGTRTLPILKIDEQVIPDSTKIIEELERRWPEPPLYPADPAEQERALALEDFFDEELGPHVRALAVRHMMGSSDVLNGAFFPDWKRPQRALGDTVLYPVIKRAFRSNLPLSDAEIEMSFEKVRAAGARWRAELQPSGYLVGDRFSVADLTAAALVSPAVAPPQFPYPQPQRDHPLLAPVRAALAESGIDEWAREMYSRHRNAPGIS